MDKNDVQKFRRVLLAMAKVFDRSKDMDDAVLEIWWAALKGWSFGEFESAADLLMRTAEFMPRPADFQKLRKAARPAIGDSWELACRTAQWVAMGWGKLVPEARERYKRLALEGIKFGDSDAQISAKLSGMVSASQVAAWRNNGGHDDSLIDSSGDPVVDEAVKAIGGYDAIARHSVEWLHRLREQFETAYTEAQGRAQTHAALPGLAPPKLPAQKALPAPANAEPVATRTEETEEQTKARRELVARIKAEAAAKRAAEPEPAERPRITLAYDAAQLRGWVIELAKDPANTPDVIIRLLANHHVTVTQIREWLAIEGAA